MVRESKCSKRLEGRAVGQGLGGGGGGDMFVYILIKVCVHFDINLLQLDDFKFRSVHASVIHHPATVGQSATIQAASLSGRLHLGWRMS